MGGQSGEGERLASDAPHNSGRPPSRGRPPTTPAARSPHRACKPREQCWAPTPANPRPQHVGGRPRQPAQWAGSRGRGSAWPRTPLTTVAGHPPRGRPLTTPTPTHPRPQHVGGGPQWPAQRAGSRGRGSARPQTPLTTVEGTTPRDALPRAPQRATPARRAHAVGPVVGPHSRTDRTRNTRVAEPRLPAP